MKAKPVEVRMVPGLPEDEVEFWMALTTRMQGAGKRGFAFYIYEYQERGIYQKRGYSSAVHYAVERLGYERRTARDLLVTGRLLSELPRCDAAFCEGRIGWSQLRLLARVATPETELEWIAKAEKLTYEKLERAVAGLQKGDRPRADKLGLPAARFTIKVRVDAATHALWEQARTKLSSESGETVTDAEILERITRLIGKRPANHRSPAATTRLNAS